LNFVDRFSENPQIRNFIGIRPVVGGGQSSMRKDGQTGERVDRQTDMTKLIVIFFCCNFANTLKVLR